MNSPIFKFPEIMKSLYQRNSNEVTLETLYKEIQLTTGIFRDNTLKQVVKSMEQLGFIKKSPNGFMIISFDGRNLIPEVANKLEKEIEQELKEFNIESGDKDAS